MDANAEFLVGTAAIDITPPAGLAMAGSLSPEDRICEGVAKPLWVKAMVIDAGGKRLAFVSFDLVALAEREVRDALARIAAETDISPDNVVWACSHTHSGPLSIRRPFGAKSFLDETWLATAMGRFVECVKKANAAKVPGRPFLSRGFLRSVMANRRERFKDGSQNNIWLQPKDIQCVGSAAMVDPEIGVLGFETDTLVRLLYNFACHANSAWGKKWHPDYPGVTAEVLGDAFTMFAPGACGDINPTTDVESFGKALGGAIQAALKTRRYNLFPAGVDAARKFIDLPFRAFDETTEPRLKDWPHPFFRDAFDAIRTSGQTQIKTPIQVARVGDVAFASIPGELFVEHGSRIKRESPFPWTFPIELSGDWLGYLITQDAWEGGGYEAIPSTSGKISPDGVEKMVDEIVDMLHALRRKQILERLFPRRITVKDGSFRTLRPLRGSDAEALAAFYAGVPEEDYFHYCPHPLDREHAARNAEKAESFPYYVCLIIETEDGSIGGYAWHRWTRNAPRGSFGICLRRDHQKLGCGRRLMAALLESAQLYGPPVMRLDVQPANAGALKLYASLGFQKTGENYREKHKDLNYHMELRLADYRPE